MKKIFIISTLFLTSCSVKYQPDWFLKGTNQVAYEQRMYEKEFQNYEGNRVIQVDGVVGEYEYTGKSYNVESKLTSEEKECDIDPISKVNIEPYQEPTRYGANRPDFRPLTH